MKKVIIVLSLAVVLVLSGCLPLLAQVYGNTVSNSQISKSLISKMQSNIKTHTFEGFTSENTFGDVLEKTDVKKIRYASLIYASELMGYPAAMQCTFSSYGGKLLLDELYFYIVFSGATAENMYEEQLLVKLDAELGDHIKNGYEDGYTEYTWEKGGWKVDMTFQEDDSGAFADVNVYPPMTIMGSLPKIPDMFPYQLGTDIYTVYQKETPRALPEGFSDFSSVEYKDGGIDVSLQFETDETGVIKFSMGNYNAWLNDMALKDSLDYYESFADGLESAAGKPEARGYGISDVEEDTDGGVSVTSGGTNGGGQGLNKQYILDAKAKYYWFEMNWTGIDFWADYGNGCSVSLDFSEEYFSGTANE